MSVEDAWASISLSFILERCKKEKTKAKSAPPFWLGAMRQLVDQDRTSKHSIGGGTVHCRDEIKTNRDSVRAYLEDGAIFEIQEGGQIPSARPNSRRQAEHELIKDSTTRIAFRPRETTPVSRNWSIFMSPGWGPRVLLWWACDLGEQGSSMT